jgi:glycosyltransferase involved in cell wall biosynthesis
MLDTLDQEIGAPDFAYRPAPSTTRELLVNGKGYHVEETAGPTGERPALALFCYEEPDSPVGRFISNIMPHLPSNLNVHLFSRARFAADGIVSHVVGDDGAGSMLERVQEFGRRASAAFLDHFPAANRHVFALGHEWSSIPILLKLRAARNIDSVLCLHSLERQRSDMTSSMSTRIEEIETRGLREARSIFVHNDATDQAARHLVPEVASRVRTLPNVFPAHEFQDNLDPGSIKARYQIGPLDPVVLYVGDMCERYGPDILIKALPPVLKNDSRLKLVLVGDGVDSWPMRVYSRYLLLDHAVRHLGHVEGRPLYELIQAADMIVVPSREPTPWWPILAGWAAGKPIAASHDAAPGLLEHERDSVLFYASVPSCVWVIERILYDAGLRRTIAENGQEKLRQRFGWPAVAACLAEEATIVKS